MSSSCGAKEPERWGSVGAPSLESRPTRSPPTAVLPGRAHSRSGPARLSAPAARQTIQDLNDPRKVTVQQGVLRDKSQPGRHLVTVVTDRTTVTCIGVIQGLVLPRVRAFHVRSREVSDTFESRWGRTLSPTVTPFSLRGSKTVASDRGSPSRPRSFLRPQFRDPAGIFRILSFATSAQSAGHGKVV